MSKMFLTFRITDQRQPTGELPDLVVADELKPSKHLAVVPKPDEIRTRRQAFDTFVGCAVANGEIIYGWRAPVELPEPDAEGARPVFGDVATEYPSVAVKAKAEKTTKKIVATPMLFDMGGK